jgi:ribosome-binding factor A
MARRGGHREGPREPGMRRNRVAEEMRAALAELLARGELKDPRLPSLVGVARVDLSPDLRQAKVLINVAGGDAAAVERALAALRAGQGFLRGELGRRLGLRYATELRFAADTEVDSREKVQRILDELHLEERKRASDASTESGDSSDSAVSGVTADPDKPDQG